MRAPIPGLIRPSSSLERPSQKTRRPPIVNAPGDVYEKEAERVSSQILSGLGQERLRATPVQGTSQTAAPPAVQEALASSGQPLDAATRGLMESRFGHDFGHVRVHADARATESARQIDAAAYTSGSNIVFGAGRYAPGTPSGQRLIAHELAHVVQQTAAGTAAAGQVVQRQPAGSPQVPSLDLRENMSPSMASALGSTVVDQFVLGSAEIPKAGEASLRSVADNILYFLKKYPGSTVHIAGHTDTVDTEEKNLKLGGDRAKAVGKFLEDEGGVPAGIITTESLGESSPVVPTKEGVAEGRNRRVNVYFRVNDLKIPPGFAGTLTPPTLDKPATPPPTPPTITPPFGLPPGSFPIEEPSLDDKMRDLDRRLGQYKPPEQKSVSQIVIDKAMEKIVPIIKKVVPEKWQKDAQDLARKGLEAGTEKACDMSIDALPVGSSEKEALKAACKAALKQKPQ